MEPINVSREEIKILFDSFFAFATNHPFFAATVAFVTAAVLCASMTVVTGWLETKLRYTRWGGLASALFRMLGFFFCIGAVFALVAAFVAVCMYLLKFFK